METVIKKAEENSIKAKDNGFINDLDLSQELNPLLRTRKLMAKILGASNEIASSQKQGAAKYIYIKNKNLIDINTFRDEIGGIKIFEKEEIDINKILIGRDDFDLILNVKW